MANFIPWKGTNAITDPTKQLNAQYTSSATNGFAVGDTVTALSTNAALRMTTLVSAAVAKILNFDSMSIDSSLASIINKIKESDPSVFGTIFNSEMVFNHGATFNTYPLTINNTAKIILRKLDLPQDDSGHILSYENYDYGMGNIYTIETGSYVKGFESKFYMQGASYENQVYYKLAYHSFIDMISEGSTLNKDNTTVFEIQTVKQGSESVIFYVRPNGNLTTTMITVTDGEKNVNTRPEIQILPHKIHYIGRSDGVNKEITWKNLFEKLDKIQ